MKKLFFAALVATVAVGGAYAQQYQSIKESDNQNAPKFDCTILEAPTCGSLFSEIYLADSDVLVTPGVGSAYDRQFN